MRVVAMVSGGKDSCYNMMQCVAEGHQIVALANLHPKDLDELDSYMYQTVGHMGIEILAKAMNTPLYRRETKGKSTQTGKHYVPTDDDEVEDLYNLLEYVKNEHQVEAVAVGAILSDYQRVRVENVCSRLNLVSLAYLWRRDQTELLQEMIDCRVHSILIKVAALGLVPERHLGKSIREVQPHLINMKEKYGLNVCGEGGEYETFTLDCPLFKQRIVVEDMQIVISSADPVCPVGYINFTKLSLAPKEFHLSCDVLVKKSLDYISDLNESTYSDLSDPDLSETELEMIEKETRMRESMSQSDILSRSNSFGRHVSASSPVPIVMAKSASVDEPSGTGATAGTFSTANTISTTTTTGGGGGGGGYSSGYIIGSLGTSAPHTQPPSPIKYEREIRPLENNVMTAINRKGWMWVCGIQGCGETPEDGMNIAMALLGEAANHNDYLLSDYCYITMYVRNILEYATLNQIYAETLNFQNPPTRVCVECPLPENCHVIMEAVAYKKNDLEGEYGKRQTMHVQGISHWAPANIGPYSQSTRVGDITYISGQIALVPGSMTIIEGGIRPQCKLALRHISRIAKAMNAKGQLRDVVQGICFITHPTYIAEARRQWERRTANAIMDYIVVPALPREALVEWQVWAHAHNDRFEYEETGCSIGEYTISIRRRWNYENNCAAIVCYVSTGLASSTTQLTQLSEDILTNHRQLAQNLTIDNINEILTYIISKLLKDSSTNSSTTRSMSITFDTLMKAATDATILASSSTPTPTNNTNNTEINMENFSNSSLNANQFATDASTPTIQNIPSTAAKNSIVKNKNKKIPAIHLKVFYQVAATPSVNLLLGTLNEFKLKIKDLADIVFTVLPACSLHNFSTFLSICGIKHE
ncbi:uncharacterized protein LOC129611354 [Condylostylus longicornis]|uniref:uncharacterized protein LOC129611354 n=1 Tax=Condylostylus longicornis TaxID=2530218 RepID=UPI00244E1A2C|nr:uncharacterized protein LOC129611354 [Condylostylus longicornis]